ncbi:MAG TPA: type II toxin-antitoxin system HipA family toxin [Actinomycetes bacterium]|nr:type II toxin-antitoxin system HipA family toxin [Actinomycetes bacterium]
MTEQLCVLLYGNLVGHLQRESSADEPSFAYEASYIGAGEVALSARLPLRGESFDPPRVRPFLLGLIPERLEAREAWARQLGASPDDTFGLLAQMGWDCPGAVQFCRPADLQTLTSRAGDYHRIDESGIAKRLRELQGGEPSWTMPDEHWSLAGQQQKFALALRDGGWYEAHGAAATTHIVKPGIGTLHHQALVEHVTMTAAGSVGVDVAATQFMQFDDQWAIVVERFDRFVDDSGAVQRVHQEDLCQAVGRVPERKYESRGGPGLSDMVRVIRQQSTDLDGDRRALADFLAINVVAGAPDGHAKNVSMLRLPGRIWVAPLYDLATGFAYDSTRVDRSVALSVGGEREPSRIRTRQWTKAADVLGIAPELLLGRVRHLASAFPAAFGESMEGVADAPGAAEVAERTLPELEKHCQRILDQL